jgi:ATP-binding cassette subfamily B protein
MTTSVRYAPAALPSRQRLIAELTRGRVLQVVGLGLLLLASSGLALAGPQLIRMFIDSATLGRSLSLLVAIAVGFLAISLAEHILAVVVTYASTHVAWVATNELREKVARRTLDLDMSFHDGHTPGELIERTDGDVTALSTFLSSFVGQVVGSVLTLLGVLVVVFCEDWRIGLAMVGFVLVAALTVGGLRDFAVQPAIERRAASAMLFGEIEERLSSAEDLRANAGGAYVTRRFQQTLASFISASMRASVATRTSWVIMLSVFAAGTVSSLLTGAFLYEAGAISLGTVYLLFRYTTLLREPLEQIADQQHVAQDAIAGFARIQQILDERPSIVDAGCTALPDGPLDVELDSVSFAYPSGERVVHELDLGLQPGKVLGVVGHTGSGKTTMARLLLRLLDPTYGAVRIGGIDLREVPLADLRQRVALVTQDVQLFGAPVRDNLTLFGAHQADDRELAEVLSDLGLGPWLRALPDGLDTVLGPGGEGASAGEAQLIAFARGFLRDPGLVILDEATSRLDPASEQRIECAVDRLLAGRSAILVAHRLGTLDRADEIVVLDQGRIVEHDSRRSLVDDPESTFAGLLATAAGGVLR